MAPPRGKDGCQSTGAVIDGQLATPQARAFEQLGPQKQDALLGHAFSRGQGDGI
jgi:hypothetical protein